MRKGHTKKELPATNFSSQQLFNTGGMLASVGESDVNLSQDVIAANLNFIQTTSSNSLQASLPHCPDAQLTEPKLTSKVAPDSSEFDVGDGLSLHTNPSENMKAECNENTGQFLLLSCNDLLDYIITSLGTVGRL